MASRSPGIIAGASRYGAGPMIIAAETATLSNEIAGATWYHTIELPGGVRTPGFYDTPEIARRFPFPRSLAGKRCLDVGTANGFWAFEMERRGAAEVVAVDIDDPADYDWPEPVPERPTRPANREAGVDKGFEISHRELGSSVERVVSRVYDLPDAGIGQFDFVFMGALMLHLRDPVKALAAIRKLTRGEFMSADSISLSASLSHPLTAAGVLRGVGEPRWWTPNLLAYRRLVRAAGFNIVEKGRIFFMPFGEGFPPPRPLREVPARELPADLSFRLAIRHLGAASSWARCLPA